MAHILLLNGPNLNLLGVREPSVYGTITLEQIHERLHQLAAESGHHLSSFQSNSEAVLIDRIHQAPASHVAYILFNPAGLTHTSVALRDALAGVAIPFIEVPGAEIGVVDALARWRWRLRVFDPGRLVVGSNRGHIVYGWFCRSGTSWSLLCVRSGNEGRHASAER